MTTTTYCCNGLWASATSDGGAAAVAVSSSGGGGANTTTIQGTASGEYARTACGLTQSAAPPFPHFVETPTEVGTLDCTSCACAFGVRPTARLQAATAVDLISTLYGMKGSLDGATVTWELTGNQRTLATKSTDDESVIAFGDTVVVHLEAGDLTGIHGDVDYSATITTVAGPAYLIAGVLTISAAPAPTITKPWIVPDLVMTRTLCDVVSLNGTENFSE